jgi:hypothetical protein
MLYRLVDRKQIDGGTKTVGRTYRRINHKVNIILIYHMQILRLSALSHM